MTAKRQRKEKDIIYLMLDQLDFHGMTKDDNTDNHSGNSRTFPVIKGEHLC